MESLAMEGGDSGDMSEVSRSPTSASTKSAETDLEDELVTVDDKFQGKSVFDMVTAELLKIGAIPLERFATEDYPEEENVIKIEKDQVQTRGVTIEGGVDGKGKEHFQAIAKIYEACMRTFESSDGISFDYKDDLGPNSRECILTVTRPAGRSRSYTSGPFFSSKSDAKAQVASVAIGLNIINFIKYGDVNSKSRSNAIVESLNAPARLKVEDGKGLSFADQTETVVDDVNVRSISQCCVEWRAGLVKPVYIHFSEPTIVPRVHGKRSKALIPPTEDELLTLKQGCALKIEISQHTSRVYSVHHVYKTRAEAKAAVALVAINQGVLDFIKYANGQTAPMVFVGELEGDADENLNREVINETNKAAQEVTIEATAVNVTLKKHQVPLDAMTLQAFTNSLPKPFPETPGLKPTGEGNPVGWLNAAAQSARGSRMSITWTYLSNAKLSSHGCLVRFNLPRMDEGRSYLVEPQFTKRSDAKSAVALLAISQNVGGWVHEISIAVENLITPEMRTKAGSLMAPMNQECTRARLVGQPTYSYIHEEGAVGCTLRVEISAELSNEYTVPVQYRTKPDARLAAILQAHHEGVIEFIRFQGAEPPADYKPEHTYDWKIARKIEEAQARGDPLLQARDSENPVGGLPVQAASGGSGEHDVDMDGGAGNLPRGSRRDWQPQHSWANNSTGGGKPHEQQRSSYTRGGYSSRGRFSDGPRGRNFSQHHNHPVRRNSSPERAQMVSPRSRAGSFASRQDFYAVTDELAVTPDAERAASRDDWRHDRASRLGSYDYSPNRADREGRGYGAPHREVPPTSLPYAERYYPHHPPPPHSHGPSEDYYGYPDRQLYPPSPGPDAGSFGSRFYSHIPPPPLPHVQPGQLWRRHDAPLPGHYPHPPQHAEYYDDYAYDEEMPPPDDRWPRGLEDERHDRGRYTTQFEARSRDRSDKHSNDWSPERSSTRYEGNSNPNQRYFNGSSRGRSRASGRARHQHAGIHTSGLGRVNRPAENTPFVPASNVSGASSKHVTASSRNATTGHLENSDRSPERDGERHVGGDITSRERHGTRKRRQEASFSGLTPASISQQISSGPTPQEAAVPGKGTVGKDGTPGRYETALNEHCSNNQIRKPVFKHEALPNGKYNVSVIVDREKFSLPTPFDSVAHGRDEVAKQILSRVKAMAKRKREGDV